MIKQWPSNLAKANSEYQGVSLQITPPPCTIFWKKEGGLSGQKIFVKVFLSKKISCSSSRKEEGGGLSTVKPPDYSNI